MDISQRFPSTEEILKLLAGRQQNGGNDPLSGFLIFGAGLLVGAGIALLLTPVPGSELRGEVSRLLKDIGVKLSAGERSGDEPPSDNRSSPSP